MSRRRIAVALLFDERTSRAVDDLRRSLGVEDLERIAPHITVAPPVDVLAEVVDDVVDGLVEACIGTDPLGLTLGPAATFAPRTPTIHLSVGGDVDRLARLRDDIRRPPLPQREQWAFVPHVTLLERATPERIEAELAALDSFALDTVVDAVHLLEHLPRPGGGRRWWRSIGAVPLTDD